MTNKEELLLVDGATGETVGVLPAKCTIMTPQQKKMWRDIMESKAQQKFFVRCECGRFFWSLYYPDEDYFPEISDAVLSRLIYLLTYLPYDRDYLVIREDASDPYRPMQKDDVRKVVGLSDKRFEGFWTDLMTTEVITEREDGKLIVCDRFKRGKLSNKDRKNMSAVKIFDGCVRYLYEHTTTKSHRYLAYLYRLIPYINASYNVFCSNPEETRRDKIKILTAKEMCWILGLDDRHETRLINMLFKLSFIDTNGDERSVITQVKNYKNKESRSFIIINPQFYQGYNITPEEATILMKEFLLTKKEEFANAAS